MNRAEKFVNKFKDNGGVFYRWAGENFILLTKLPELLEKFHQECMPTNLEIADRYQKNNDCYSFMGVRDAINWCKNFVREEDPKLPICGRCGKPWEPFLHGYSHDCPKPIEINKDRYIVAITYILVEPENSFDAFGNKNQAKQYTILREAFAEDISDALQHAELRFIKGMGKSKVHIISTSALKL